MRSHDALTARPLRRFVAAGAFCAALIAFPAVARQADERPQPTRPGIVNPDVDGSDVIVPAGVFEGNGEEASRDPLGRRKSGDELVPLGFKDVELASIFKYVAEETGKVVIPINLTTLQTKKVTLISDALVPRSRALDLIFETFRLNGVGVIESRDQIIVGDLNQLAGVAIPPIIRADQDIMQMTQKGNLVSAFFQLKNAKASSTLEIITQERELPPYATATADDNSNQILVFGDVALCQQLKRLIDQLDNVYKRPSTRTFVLRYADAIEVQTLIEDLYSDSGTSRAAAGSRNVQRGRTNQASNTTDPLGPEIELRTAVNTAQNAVTVVGDPEIVDRIAELITTKWDLERPKETFRIFDMKFSDAVKLAEALNEVLGQSTGGGGAGVRRAGGQQGGTGVTEALSGVYEIQPLPETNQILVLAKTVESLEFIGELIDNLDQESEIGLPFVVELKHASAVELAEQLNALLAEAGQGADIAAPEVGLSGRNLEGTDGGAGDAGSAGRLSFPWQRSGRAGDESAPESQLIGRVRIVPITRQNALAILCPRPQTESVKKLIGYFDRPGRQVMLSVIIAEIELTDDFSLGLRLSSSDGITSASNPDNLFSAGVNSSANREGSGGSLFDSTVLDANLNLNVVLQALQQDTNIRVIQQPVVFTADNQEAFFFDGQEIPFITQTTVNTNGNPSDSFEYRDVGVILNARPRITANREVDLDLRLELSAVVPGQTLFGGAIIDKRETTTNVVVRNGQTIVLSGILRESESRITRKVPLFGDIPLLGELFKTRSNQTVTSELVAFITPMVVDDPEENDTNFQEDWRRRLETLNLPIDQQVEIYEDTPEDFRQRFLPSRSSNESIGPRPGLTEPIGGGSGAEVYDPAQQGRSGNGG
ncbi:MAG: secretin N-terminal domain-containing protein [Phycisphaerales bacterium]